MRTTIDLAPDVEAAVATMRAERNLGLSEAVNELARAGLTRRTDYVYVPRTFDLGLKVDITNIAEVLEMLDEDE